MTRFSGQSAIILGAAGRGNMGQAIARRLARDGAQVLVAGRNEAVLRELAEDIGCRYQTADASSETDLAALVATAREAFGGLHIGVNATGRNLVKPLLETTREELETLTDTQFIAPYLFLQAMVRGMTGGGSIVHISTVTTRNLLPDHAVYMGTKAGMERVVEAFAYEFGGRGVRVNCVSPGLTRTPMTESIFQVPEVAEAIAKGSTMKRLGTPEDIAAAVAWLCDPECFVTGENLQVNGGARLIGPPRMT